MPRYFFHTADGGVHRDPEGSECRDDAAARRGAVRYAGAVLNDEPDLLWDGGEFRVTVTNEAEQLLFTVEMRAIDAPAAA